MRVWGYTYNAASRTYTADRGFPVAIADGEVEAVVIDRDSTGTLWATFVLNGHVMVTHTRGAVTTWVAPYVLPVGPAAKVRPEPEGDESALVAFGGNHVGIMFSSQVDPTGVGVMFWATHTDGTGDRSWMLTRAYAGQKLANEHINLKALPNRDRAGVVLAAVKTSLRGGREEQEVVHLLRLRRDGTWTSHRFGTVTENHTRPLVQVDIDHRKVYVFAVSPCCRGDVIYMKVSSLDALSFPPGRGTPFIESPTDVNLNNPTGTKQLVGSASGLLVLVGDDVTHTYLHNYKSLTSAPRPAPATRTAGTKGSTGRVDASPTAAPAAPRPSPSVAGADGGVHGAEATPPPGRRDPVVLSNMLTRQAYFGWFSGFIAFTGIDVVVLLNAAAAALFMGITLVAIARGRRRCRDPGTTASRARRRRAAQALGRDEAQPGARHRARGRDRRRRGELVRRQAEFARHRVERRRFRDIAPHRPRGEAGIDIRCGRARHRSLRVATSRLAPHVGYQAGSAIVTSAPTKGASLREGSVALSVSGRPVRVLQGARPAYRDLGPGTTGPDVQQLEESLARLGFDPGARDGTYDGATAAAVAAWYRSAGWAPFGPSDDQLQTLRAAEADRFGIQLERANAEETLATARTSRATAAATVAKANTTLDAAIAGRRVVQIQLDAAGATQPPLTSVEHAALDAALIEATSVIDVARADLGAAGTEVASTGKAIEVAQRRVTLTTSRETALTKIVNDIAAAVGIQVPADEVLFVPSLPLRVDDVSVKTGEKVAGPVMTITNSQLAIDAALSGNDAKLVHDGASVRIEEPELAVAVAGTVTDVADTPGTDGVDAGRFHLQVTPTDAPASLAGASVVLTITVGATEGEVLAVPVAALSVAANGTSRVQVQEPSLETRYVTVKPGLAAKGLVAVTPLRGRLSPGDLVVTGRGATVRRPRAQVETPTVRLPAKETPITPTPVSPVARPRPLAELLIDTVPKGFVELGRESAPSGPFDLETFLSHSDNPQRDRALLSDNHFVRGQVRSWQRPGASGTERMVASVFEFEGASDAVTFLLRKQDQTLAEEGAVAFPVTGGIGLRYVHRTGEGLVHAYTIAFHSDNQLFYLGAFYSTEQPPDEILAMEARQRERIAPSATIH